MKGLVIGVLGLTLLDVIVSTSAASRLGSLGTSLANIVNGFLSVTKPGLGSTPVTSTPAVKNYKPGTAATTAKKKKAITDYVHAG